MWFFANLEQENVRRLEAGQARSEAGEDCGTSRGRVHRYFEIGGGGVT
jgi:hypothetical protein